MRKTAIFLLILLTVAAQAFSPPALAESARDMKPGTWTGSGGHRWLRFGDYTWRVLKVAVNEGRKEALLLTEDAVDGRSFNRDRYDGNDWRTSDIKEWLNGSFYRGAFSESEKGAILTAYYRYGGRYGGDRTDSSKIFLLSADEALNGDYFDDYDDRITRWDGESWGWWLRSPGFDFDIAAIVTGDGKAYGGYDYYHNYVTWDGAVRPALILNLSSPIFTSSQYEILHNLR